VAHVTQPLIAGHRLRTSNTYGVKHRSTARETNSRHHRLHMLRHVCRPTSTVRFSLFTPPSVPVSITVSIYPNYAFRSSRPIPRPLQHLSNHLREGVMWDLPHERQSTDSVAMQRLDLISMVTNSTLLRNNTRAVTTMETKCDLLGLPKHYNYGVLHRSRAVPRVEAG
jgi:hypothetical protein